MSRSRPSRITIKDIAAELGLDYSSVGYALRGKGTLSEETRRRIQATAERMGYVRNHAASQMSARRSHAIGVIVPNLVLGYNEFVQHLLSLARNRGYRLQIAVSEFDHALEDAGVRTMIAAGVDGLILRSLHSEWSTVPPDAMLRTLPQRGIAVVSHGASLAGSGFSRVVPQANTGVPSLAAHLARQGFRRPVYLRPNPKSQLRYGVAAIEELLKALRTTGMAEELPLVMPDGLGDETPEREAYHRHVDEMLAHAGVGTGRELLRSALARSPQPDLLICQNEMTAIGVLLEAQRLGVAVPRDLGVCATTRNMLVALAPISLTNVDVYNADMAVAAFELLLGELEDVAPAGQVRGVPRVLSLGATTLRHAEGP